MIVDVLRLDDGKRQHWPVRPIEVKRARRHEVLNALELNQQITNLSNSTSGRAFRWAALLPVAVILFGLARLIPLFLWMLVFGAGTPGWLGILVLLFVGGPAVIVGLFGGAYWAGMAVAAIAPDVRIGVSIVGLLYAVALLVDLASSFGPPIWIWVIKVVVGIAIFIGLLSAYQAAQERW